ncbi:thyrostimulin alpha-2 subunit [Condylostylus longicornis]|uniref:thyrostimulin alpha-2 subunit n=1 Tax=Condylostylus longicornis TaxID=2530218 RepID=UPI00244DF25A|nr:thyrostimulin alpha-2 subunit [Condylostylus longicornis]
MLWLRLGSLLSLIVIILGNDVWQRPGCHKVGNTRKITIPDCVSFTITTNACRGFCESYSVPSLPFVALNSLKSIKPIISIGQCCNMMESEQIEKRVYCVDGERTLTFKSAVSCSCYHCKKN